MEHLLSKATAFENAAAIIRAQVPYRNRIWMKNLVDRDVGHDVIDLVADVRRFEETGRKRDTTWAKGEGKGGKRRVQNTMGYQTRGQGSK